MNSTGETAGAAISPLADVAYVTKGWNSNPCSSSGARLLLSFGEGGGGYLVERKGAEAEEINGGKKWRLGERGIYKRLYGEEGAQGWLEFWNSSEFRGTHVNEVLAILSLLFIGIIFSKKGN
jgi:hypothetical protein